ncbi:MAG: hypothetical protein P8M11_06995 [Planctomycetota bacterium]|nr:hypothetical protein [Planctomycetota bacterium]
MPQPTAELDVILVHLIHALSEEVNLLLQGLEEPADALAVPRLEGLLLLGVDLLGERLELVLQRGLLALEGLLELPEAVGSFLERRALALELCLLLGVRGAEPGEVPLDLLALISPLRAVRASLGLDALKRLGVLLLEELAPTLRGLEPLLSTREVETRAALGSRGGLPAEEEADQGASDETSERGGD